MITTLLIILFTMGTIFTKNVAYSKPISVPPSQTETQTSYQGYVLNTGSSSPASTVKEKNIIKEYSELTSFCNNYYVADDMQLDELTDKYTSDYFKTKSLAILFIPVGSSNTSVKFISATKEVSNVKIDYKTTTSGEIGLTVMSYSLIVVEIPKDITGIV